MSIFIFESLNSSSDKYMNKNQSLVFDYLRFPLTILVIILHAYTATQNVEWLKIAHPIYRFITYNFSLLWGI